MLCSRLLATSSSQTLYVGSAKGTHAGLHVLYDFKAAALEVSRKEDTY